MSDKLEADFTTMLSSDMIGQIVEEYFNKHMYKKKVKVVDLKATESGYMFLLAFMSQQNVQAITEHPILTEVKRREVIARENYERNIAQQLLSQQNVQQYNGVKQQTRVKGRFAKVNKEV